MLQASIMLWGDMSLGHLLSTQRRVPLLWVLDAVPFVLALMLWMTGRQRQEYEGMVGEHEARDVEQNAELRARIKE
ncbi:MAG: hypothetical protein AAFV01_14905, partial [Bacteroidota bacterium]